MKINLGVVIAAALIIGGVALFAVFVDRALRNSNQALALAFSNDVRITALERKDSVVETRKGVFKSAAKAVVGLISWFK